MSVNLPHPGEIHPVAGVRLAASAAGIKATDRDDVAIIEFAEGTTTAGVFTRNRFRAPPVDIAETLIGAGNVRALLINSGNANAATGAAGRDDAEQLCEVAASALGIGAAQVAPFSTGVIGERLPVAQMIPAVETAATRLAEQHWEAVARSMMTTDTGPKVVSRIIQVGGSRITVTGMAKGAGMMKPDMATMLAFVCCDAAVSAQCLRNLVQEAANVSFNRISIDADTSTNDAFVIAATGAARNVEITETAGEDYEALAAGLIDVSRTLAQYIVRDGEGASKFVTIEVTGGATTAECSAVAYTVAESPLVKTALFASDPNWGRLCMAIGRSGVADLDQRTVNISLDDVPVVHHGMQHPDYREEDGARVMAQDEFGICIELGRGDSSTVIWTSDLSYDYVRINAEYRT